MQAAEHAAEPVECEIKLVGARGALRGAEAAIRRAAGGRVRWSTDTLVSDYYDTVDRRLSRRGATLRVRKKNRAYLQTVKAESVAAGAMSARPEWEMSIRGARPNLELLPPEARQRLGLVLPGELRKVFTVDVERKKTELVLEPADGAGAAKLEVAVDRGEIKAGGRRQAVSEVELELIEGDGAALYGLAMRLADAGLGVGMASKAERGFALLDGNVVPRPKKAPRFVLDADITVSDAIQRIFTAGIANVIENEPAAVDGTDPEGVHQLRVSVRRMRSVLSVFRAMLDPARIAWAKDELRWLMGEMGPARDWDVFIAEMLGGVDGVGIDRDALAQLARRAEDERAAGYDRARAAIASPRYARLLLGMSRFVETHGWLPADAAPDHALFRPVGKVADGILDKAYKKLRKRGRRMAKKSLAERHKVRIELKKFRYATDFLQSLYPPDQVGPFLKASSRMQDRFGHLNDISVAETLLGHLLAAKGAGAAERRLLAKAGGQVMGWHARGLADEEPRFLADWKAFKDAPPFWGTSTDGGG